MEAYNNFNTPHNGPKYDPRKIKPQIYEPLEGESPYKQKGAEKRSDKFNFIKMKTNKTPKANNDSNQINLLGEEFGGNFKQNQFGQYNLENSFSPERRKNDYSSP
jgi:hypothetical protein